MVQHIVQLTVALHVPNEAQSVSGSSHIDASWWQLSAARLHKFRRLGLALSCSLRKVYSETTQRLLD